MLNLCMAHSGSEYFRTRYLEDGLTKSHLRVIALPNPGLVRSLPFKSHLNEVALIWIDPRF